MRLNILVNNPGAKRDKKRLGRGIGSGKGKTCGRGVKGQKSRAGVAIKGFEGGQTPLIKRLAKRGFNCRNSKIYHPINITRIIQLIESGKIINSGIITKEHLQKANAIKNKNSLVKLVASESNLQFAIELQLDSYTVAAKEIIEKAGGKVL